MATQLQIRRGTSSQVAAFTGAEGEIVVNTTNDSVHVNDGSTAGGFELARADLNNVSDTSLNAALTGNTVSALTITTLTLGSTAITATGAEINILDGVTATAAELNILDGVTSTAAELNILDGVTATTAELNYVDGVTSAIQAQIDAKAALAQPQFTDRVGIGVAAHASDALNITSTNQHIRLNNGSELGILALTSDGDLDFWAHGADEKINFRTGTGSGTVAMNVVGTNVGIGTASPSSTAGWGTLLEVSGTTNAGIKLTETDTANGDYSLGVTAGTFRIWDETASAFRLVLDASGAVAIGSTSATARLEVTGAFGYASGANSLATSVSKAAARIRGSSDASTSLFFGSLTNDAEQYIQSSNGAGSAADDLVLNPYGGNVGYGVVPTSKFHVKGSADTIARIEPSNNTGKATLLVSSTGSGDGGLQYNAGNNIMSLFAYAGMRFYVGTGNLSGGYPANERARLDSSGALYVNTTALNNSGSRLAVWAESGSISMETRCKANVSYFPMANYSSSGTYIGGINASTTATSLATSSDRRLKSGIKDADDAGSKVDAIQVRQFDWIANDAHQDYGMVAQELQEVIPNVIHESPDADKMLSVDYAGLVPMLVKEIQSLRARVAQLENN